MRNEASRIQQQLLKTANNCAHKIRSMIKIACFQFSLTTLRALVLVVTGCRELLDRYSVFFAITEVLRHASFATSPREASAKAYVLQGTMLWAR